LSESGIMVKELRKIILWK